MKRIFPDFAYGDTPRQNCWWDETVPTVEWPVLTQDLQVDVAVIGAGFTGMSAAIGLAKAGASVAVLEANFPGWGASGRNGGFCCLGGSKLDDAALIRRFGASGMMEYRQAEVAAVSHVSDTLKQLGIDADVHSSGETLMAHRAKDVQDLRIEAERIQRIYGVEPKEIPQSELAANGMKGPFFGAVTNPIGFGLNPRKYLNGLFDAATGVQLFQNSPVMKLEKVASGYCLQTPSGNVQSDQVVVATNGYSSDDIPKWIKGRYMPAQSSVLVTRPLTEQELQAQGWNSAQCCYDTRELLHYFRLMPDGRFLFGNRGGLRSTPSSERAAYARTRADFEKMFPTWQHVTSSHQWSGMVCISLNLLPFAGPVPHMPGVFASLAYHGNGVAMGSYAGKLLSDLMLGAPPAEIPRALRGPLARFPLGGARRAIMPFVYLQKFIADRI